MKQCRSLRPARTSVFDVRCDCGESYHVRDENVGARIRCRRCGALLIVIRPPDTRTAEARLEGWDTRNSGGVSRLVRFVGVAVGRGRRVARESRWLAAALGWGAGVAVVIAIVTVSGPGDHGQYS